MKIIKKTAICIAIYVRKEDWSIDILVLSSSFSCRPDASFISFFSFVFLSFWYFLFSLVTSRHSSSLFLYLPFFFLFLFERIHILKSTSPFTITPFFLSLLCALQSENEEREREKNHYHYSYQHKPNDVVCENVC